MGIELPGELADVAAKAGVQWPKADEVAMKASADAWRQAATRMAALSTDADGTANKALSAVRGQTGTAASAHWHTFVAPDGGHLTAAVQGCHAAADRLDHAAEQVGAAKVEIVRHLVTLAKNSDAANQAAAAGHPTALAGLTTAVHGTAANVASVNRNLASSIRLDNGTATGGSSPLANASPGAVASTVTGPATGLTHDVMQAAAVPLSGAPLSGAHAAGGGDFGSAGGGDQGGLLGIAGGATGASAGHGGPLGVGPAAVTGGPTGHGGLLGQGGLLGPGGVADAVTGQTATAHELTGPGGSGPGIGDQGGLVGTGLGGPGGIVGTGIGGQGGTGIAGTGLGAQGGLAGTGVGGPGPGDGQGGLGLGGGQAGSGLGLGHGDGHGGLGQGGLGQGGGLLDVGSGGAGVGPVGAGPVDQGGHGLPIGGGGLDQSLPVGGGGGDQGGYAGGVGDPGHGHGPIPPLGVTTAQSAAGAVAPPPTGLASSVPLDAGNVGVPSQQSPSGFGGGGSAGGAGGLAAGGLGVGGFGGGPAGGLASGGGLGAGGLGAAGGFASGAGAGGLGAAGGAGAGGVGGPGVAAGGAGGGSVSGGTGQGAGAPAAGWNSTTSNPNGPQPTSGPPAGPARSAGGGGGRGPDLIAPIDGPRAGPSMSAQPARQAPRSGGGPGFGQAVVNSGLPDLGRPARPPEVRREAVALFLVYLFPIGHLPTASSRPVRQLPPPPVETDFAAGLRFEPHDHPDAALIDDRPALAAVVAGWRAEPAPAGLPADHPAVAALAADADPLGEVSEYDWERRFVVRPPSPEGDVAAEYAWPPGELFPEGGHEPGEPVVLPEGVVLDRFGTPEGRVFAPGGTPFGHRALPLDQLATGYHRYRVLRPLPVWQSVSAPWFGLSGGGERLRTVYPAADLVAFGYLADITNEDDTPSVDDTPRRDDTPSTDDTTARIADVAGLVATHFASGAAVDPEATGPVSTATIKDAIDGR